jgi:hypothetical protein
MPQPLYARGNSPLDMKLGVLQSRSGHGGEEVKIGLKQKKFWLSGISLETNFSV